MKINAEFSHVYTAPKSIAVEGICLQGEVSNLVKQLMFGSERQAIAASIVSKVLNNLVYGSGLTLSNPVPEDRREALAQNVACTQ